MKRVMLFLVTNIAVMLVLSLVYQVVLMAIGPEALAEFSRNGINFGVLAIFSFSPCLYRTIPVKFLPYILQFQALSCKRQMKLLAFGPVRRS